MLRRNAWRLRAFNTAYLEERKPGDTWASIDTTGLANTLLQYTVTNKVAFVQGSPSVGKSSLKRVMHAAASAYGFNTTCMPLDVPNITQAAVEKELVKRTDASSRRACLFLIDEAQTMIRENAVQPSTMFKNDFYAVYFGTTINKVAVRDNTPVELAANKFWLYGPSLDRGVVEQFARDVLIEHNVADDVAERVACQVFDYVGGTMGVLIRVLKYIVEHDLKRLPNPVEFFHDRDNLPRVIVNGSDVWQQDKAKCDLAAELLAVGHKMIDTDTPDDIKALCRRGFVAPTHDDITAKHAPSHPELVPFGARGTYDVTWAHAWQADFARDKNITPHETVPLDEARFRLPVDVLLRALPNFEVHHVVASVFPGVTSTQKEAFFDGALREALAKAHVSTAEVTVQGQPSLEATNPGQRSYGVPDQWLAVSVHHDPRPSTPVIECWAIELVKDATMSNLVEHMTRFAVAGKYAVDALKDWIVLDCRTKPIDADAAKAWHKKAWAEAFPSGQHATRGNGTFNLVTLSPHMGKGWNVLVLDINGHRLQVPRDGVPRHVLDWSTKTLELVSARRLYEPPDEIIVTDGKGTTTFPVKPEQPTVMHLKKAIAPDWPPLRQALIKIKTPDGTECKDKDQLHAGVEYTYELPK